MNPVMKIKAVDNLSITSNRNYFATSLWVSNYHVCSYTNLFLSYSPIIDSVVIKEMDNIERMNLTNTSYKEQNNYVLNDILELSMNIHI